jgi:hypothetical protein
MTPEPKTHHISIYSQGSNTVSRPLCEASWEHLDTVVLPTLRPGDQQCPDCIVEYRKLLESITPETP